MRYKVEVAKQSWEVAEVWVEAESSVEAADIALAQKEDLDYSKRSEVHYTPLGARSAESFIGMVD